MTYDLVIHFFIVVAVQLPVLLYFFRDEKLQVAHFTFLSNAFILFFSNMLITKAGVSYYPLQLLVVLLHAVAIYFFWTIEFKKALLISVAANVVSFGVYELLTRLHLLDGI